MCHSRVSPKFAPGIRRNTSRNSTNGAFSYISFDTQAPEGYHVSICFSVLGKRMVPGMQRKLLNGVCEIEFVDASRVKAAQKALPADDVVNALAETFRTLSDPTRVRIIAALSHQELCVCDLANLLRLTNSAISHQLRLLRGQRLVKFRREGKIAYYTLDDEHIRNLFAEGIRHLNAGHTP